MRYVLPLLLLLLRLQATAQDTARIVSPNPEKNIETSYESGEVLLIAAAGLAVLIAAYFLYRRRRR